MLHGVARSPNPAISGILLMIPAVVVVIALSGFWHGLMLTAWFGIVVGIIAVVHWLLRSEDQMAAATIEWDPPTLPPSEGYEHALAFGEEGEELGDRLYEGGNYNSAFRVYATVQQAYTSAIEIARAHDLDVERADRRLADVEERVEQAHRRRNFWRLTIGNRGSNRDKLRPPQGGYSAVLDRAQSAEQWAEKLFTDSHYSSALTEFRSARRAYREAIELASNHHVDATELEDNLARIEERIDVCRKREGA